MKVRKNSKPCHDPACDECRRDSTHRVQVSEGCIWQWLCDEHTDQAIRRDHLWLASPYRLRVPR